MKIRTRTRGKNIFEICAKIQGRMVEHEMWSIEISLTRMHTIYLDGNRKL